MKRFPLILSTIIILTGCASQPREGETARGGEKERLAIAVSSNRQLDTESCGCSAQNLGGIEREWHLISQKRVTSPGLLYFSVGTTFVPIETGFVKTDVETYRRKAEVVAELLEKMGITALAPSARDFALGRSTVEALAGKVKYPFLSANIVDKASEQPLFQRFWKTERQGTPITVTALTSPSELPANTDGTVTVLPPDQALANVLRENEGRFVIVLSSLTPKDRAAIVEKFPQVHVILGGAEPPHTLAADLKDKKRIYFNPMSRGRQVGFLELDVKLPFAGFYNQEIADFVLERRDGYQAEEQALLKKKRGKDFARRMADLRASQKGLDQWPSAKWEGASEYWTQSVTVASQYEKGKNTLSTLAERARSLGAK